MKRPLREAQRVKQQPKPSGTVVVLRDRGALEVLLLQRAAREGQPGPWVFPGGKVDASDRRPGGGPEADARRAAVREAQEEAGLPLAADGLVPLSRWITPRISPKRFDTWFYLGAVGASRSVRVDGMEIGDHRWLAPRDALDAHQRGAIRLAPPTFVTIAWLTEFQRGEQALSTWAPRPVPLFEPRVLRGEDGACMLYAGDAGYEQRDSDAPGPRHRLWARPGAWRYELRLA
jgi:8-oxo-dGTP pyrophosphatase MutT (NUDIX family)